MAKQIKTQEYTLIIGLLKQDHNTTTGPGRGHFVPMLSKCSKEAGTRGKDKDSAWQHYRNRNRLEA